MTKLSRKNKFSKYYLKISLVFAALVGIGIFIFIGYNSNSFSFLAKIPSINTTTTPPSCESAEENAPVCTHTEKDETTTGQAINTQYTYTRSSETAGNTTTKTNKIESETIISEGLKTDAKENKITPILKPTSSDKPIKHNTIETKVATTTVSPGKITESTTISVIDPNTGIIITSQTFDTTGKPGDSGYETPQIKSGLSDTCNSSGASCAGRSSRIASCSWAPSGRGVNIPVGAGNDVEGIYGRECMRCNNGTWEGSETCGKGEAEHYIASIDQLSSCTPNPETGAPGVQDGNAYCLNVSAACWSNGTWYSDTTGMEVINGATQQCANGHWTNPDSGFEAGSFNAQKDSECKLYGKVYVPNSSSCETVATCLDGKQPNRDSNVCEEVPKKEGWVNPLSPEQIKNLRFSCHEHGGFFDNATNICKSSYDLVTTTDGKANTSRAACVAGLHDGNYITCDDNGSILTIERAITLANPPNQNVEAPRSEPVETPKNEASLLDTYNKLLSIGVGDIDRIFAENCVNNPDCIKYGSVYVSAKQIEEYAKAYANQLEAYDLYLEIIDQQGTDAFGSSWFGDTGEYHTLEMCKQENWSCVKVANGLFYNYLTIDQINTKANESGVTTNNEVSDQLLVSPQTLYHQYDSDLECRRARGAGEKGVCVQNPNSTTYSIVPENDPNLNCDVSFGENCSWSDNYLNGRTSIEPIDSTLKVDPNTTDNQAILGITGCILAGGAVAIATGGIGLPALGLCAAGGLTGAIAGSLIP